MKWAVVCEKTKRVYNCIEWDGKANWPIPKGFYVIQDEKSDRFDLHDPATKTFIKHHMLTDWPEFNPEEGKRR
jgi:hypothetical protein